jgi:DNA polymerase III delta subunit
MPVIVLSGEEEFLIANRLSQLKNDLLDPAWSSFNFARLSNPDLTEIIDTCAMVPFGAGNKFIQIDNNNLFCKSKAKSGTSSAKSTSTTEKDKQLKSLESSLEQVADNTYIVFVCLYNFDSSLKISKLVQKRAELESFPKKRYFI